MSDLDHKVARLVAGRVAHLAQLSDEERHATTAAARAAVWEHYRRRVDPDGTLDEKTCHERVQRARKADMATLRARGLEVRRANSRARKQLQMDRDLDETIAAVLRHVADELGTTPACTCQPLAA